jgi:carboxyl-terminal processing protease
VKRSSLLLLLLILVAPAGAHAQPVGQAFDQLLVAQVTGNALAFMAPRTLDAIGLPTMALWGLQGLTTLDARLVPALPPPGKVGPMLTLAGPRPRVLLARAAPGDTDAAGWGEAIGQTMRAAWNASATVRRAGTQQVIDYFFDELFNHMDPYSRYVSPVDADADRLRRDGRAGIGVSVVASGGGIAVAQVQAGSPAAQAGLRPGEMILAVGWQPTQGADRQDVEAMLAGPDHSHVKLTVRDRRNHIRSLDLERIRVPPETVTTQWVDAMLDVRMSGFSSDTASRLAQELIRGQSEAHPLHGVVIDLRGNRGGLLAQAVAAAAMLQPSGVVAVTAGRDPDATHIFLADGRDLARNLPVVVLVDGSTASAAEILAAALADQHRAVVVGSATLGKGLVQTIAELPDGGELLVTWSRVLAPAGWPIQGLGVLPQVCTSLGPDTLARQLTALAHGIQPMAAALARHRAARPPLSPATVLDIRAACPAAIGQDGDLDAAHFLIDTPRAYQSALLSPPSVAPDPAWLGATVPPRLTARPGLSN